MDRNVNLIHIQDKSHNINNLYVSLQSKRRGDTKWKIGLCTYTYLQEYPNKPTYVYTNPKCKKNLHRSMPSEIMVEL